MNTFTNERIEKARQIKNLLEWRSFKDKWDGVTDMSPEQTEQYQEDANRAQEAVEAHINTVS